MTTRIHPVAGPTIQLCPPGQIKTMKFPRTLTALAILLCTSILGIAQEKKTLNVLFIGNSYTARHNLAKTVKALAEEADPALSFNPSAVIYGGRTLSDHWQLGTQNVVNLHALTADEVNASLATLKAGFENAKLNGYAKGAITRQKKLLEEVGKPHPKWDVVVLQSYRDDIEGDPSKYAKFAPKFAELAKAQGAKVILYETTPTTQNAKALTAAPDPAPVQKKATAIAKLAKETGATAAPTSLAALKCQTKRPDITLRFINDAHLNHAMSYMTACAIYAAIFEKSPVGLQFNTVTDIRFFEAEPGNKTKDRDGKPITRNFSEKDRTCLLYTSPSPRDRG